MTAVPRLGEQREKQQQQKSLSVEAEVAFYQPFSFLFFFSSRSPSNHITYMYTQPRDTHTHKKKRCRFLCCLRTYYFTRKKKKNTGEIRTEWQKKDERKMWRRTNKKAEEKRAPAIQEQHSLRPLKVNGSSNRRKTIGTRNKTMAGHPLRCFLSVLFLV